MTTIARRNGGIFPRERIASYIDKGEPAIAAHGSRDMPVWGPNLAALAPQPNKPVNERIEAIVQYLVSLQTK